jgi:hypothetical protein
LVRFSNVSPKHSQLAQEQFSMQSQCCLHNIVGERISPSRTAEFGLKFLVRLTPRHRDRKTDPCIGDREQNRIHRLNTQLM